MTRATHDCCRTSNEWSLCLISSAPNVKLIARITAIFSKQRVGAFSTCTFKMVISSARLCKLWNNEDKATILSTIIRQAAWQCMPCLGELTLKSEQYYYWVRYGPAQLGQLFRRLTITSLRSRNGTAIAKLSCIPWQPSQPKTCLEVWSSPRIRTCSVVLQRIHQ